MKKWHIEGIISFTETPSRKLVVPDAHQMNLWSTAFSHEPRKESVYIAFLRNIVTFFLRSVVVFFLSMLEVQDRWWGCV